ncbi:MAG TPA: hypothetical protein VJQ86_11055 [Rhodanobacteraceae bacterium]|nr:hypothetical protein [Rhodanobacteraceae bacterium]
MTSSMPLDRRIRREMACRAKKISPAGLSIIQPDSMRAPRAEALHHDAPRFHPRGALLRRECRLQASIHAGFRERASAWMQLRLDVYTSFAATGSVCGARVGRRGTQDVAIARASFAAKN